MKPNVVFSVLAMMTIGSQASGQDFKPDRVYIPLASEHFGNFEDDLLPGETINEFNPGALFSWENRFAGLNYTAGAYKDSFGDPAVYLAVAKMWGTNSDFTYGVALSYVEPIDNDPLTTGLIAPSLQVNYKNLFANLTGGPNGDGFAGVLGMGLTFSLD